MKNIAPLCLFLQLFFVKIVSTMDRGKGKAVAEKDVDKGFGIGKWSLHVKNPDILTVHFNGRIEPPIADGKTPYKARPSLFFKILMFLTFYQYNYYVGPRGQRNI
jgi:hypothetical protein